ncbi:MAG: class II fructose-bisphosphate aldolase [Candidatus Schekmanbacteria bacterium]|nr:class II fructose-bisphosphate aldolase [Candidatus Schekmanbacteria bacterium]
MKVVSLNELKNEIKPFINLEGSELRVTDEKTLRESGVDLLIYNAVFNPDENAVKLSKWIIREAAQSVGIYPSSIQGLYAARAAGKYSGITTPAINIRVLTYDVARSIFKTGRANNTGAFLFEIAKSEIGYTFQEPSEYSACVLAAAIKENVKGPVFILGDHYQVNASKFAKDRGAEISGLKKLIKDSIEAGFYNIDIDSSTLVDLSKATIDEQQELNYEIAAELTGYIRSLEPKGITVAVGGEIGEVGKKNSTPEELRAYLKGYYRCLPKYGKDLAGIIKISVQTGTSHGGIPLPDGRIAEVKLDLETLGNLSKISQAEFKLGGAVQHGASTLPEEAFGHFPQREAVEVHLATAFQNMIYDSRYFPSELKQKIYAAIKEKFISEKKDSETEEQFIYKTRKKGFGQYKKEIWDLSQDTKAKILGELESKFDLIFKKLNSVNTTGIVNESVKPVPVKTNRPV